MIKYIKLNDKVNIPIVGSGTNTYGKEGTLRKSTWQLKMVTVILTPPNCIKMKKSSLPRDEFFITTILNTMEDYHGADWAHAEIETSLEKLQTDYFVAFLIHFPWDNHDEILEAWRILEDYYERGVFKTIGVSNFEQEHLDLTLEKGKVKPVVNQIKSNLGNGTMSGSIIIKRMVLQRLPGGRLAELKMIPNKFCSKSVTSTARHRHRLYGVTRLNLMSSSFLSHTIKTVRHRALIS